MTTNEELNNKVDVLLLVVEKLKEQVSYLETRVDEVTPDVSIRPDNIPDRPKEVT